MQSVTSGPGPKVSTTTERFFMKTNFAIERNKIADLLTLAAFRSCHPDDVKAAMEITEYETLRKMFLYILSATHGQQDRVRWILGELLYTLLLQADNKIRKMLPEKVVHLEADPEYLNKCKQDTAEMRHQLFERILLVQVLRIRQ